MYSDKNVPTNNYRCFAKSKLLISQYLAFFRGAFLFFYSIVDLHK